MRSWADIGFRILTEPENALIRQYAALLATEHVALVFRDDAIAELARIAAQVNERTENIGARRLHTVMERLLDEISTGTSRATSCERSGAPDRRRGPTSNARRATARRAGCTSAHREA